MVTELDHVLGTDRASVLNARRDSFGKTLLVIVSRLGQPLIRKISVYSDINMEEIHLFQSGCK